MEVYKLSVYSFMPFLCVSESLFIYVFSWHAWWQEIGSDIAVFTLWVLSALLHLEMKEKIDYLEKRESIHLKA